MLGVLLIAVGLKVVHMRNFAQYVGRRTLSYAITALHGMQTRFSDENSVRPSVRHTREL